MRIRKNRDSVNRIHATAADISGGSASMMSPGYAKHIDALVSD
jgi:hypothetical protein